MILSSFRAEHSLTPCHIFLDEKSGKGYFAAADGMTFKFCMLKFSSLQFLEPTSMYSLGMQKAALQDVKEWNMCNWKNTTTITDTKAALQQFLPRCHAFVEMQKGPIKEYYGWFYLSDFICLTLFSNTFTMIGYCSMCLCCFIWRTLCYIRYFVFFSHTVMEI